MYRLTRKPRVEVTPFYGNEIKYTLCLPRAPSAVFVRYDDDVESRGQSFRTIYRSVFGRFFSFFFLSPFGFIPVRRAYNDVMPVKDDDDGA